jgi:hypothetical protein
MSGPCKIQGEIYYELDICYKSTFKDEFNTYSSILDYIENNNNNNYNIPLLDAYKLVFKNNKVLLKNFKETKGEIYFELSYDSCYSVVLKALRYFYNDDYENYFNVLETLNINS